jgi:hypothetical protein
MSRFRPAISPRPATLAPPVPERASIANERMGPAVSPPPVPMPRMKEGMGRLGVLLGLYILMHVAPVAEFLATYVDLNLREVVIVGVIVSLGIMFTGRLDRFLQVSVAKWWIVLGLLYALASGLGTYPRQSMTFMAEYLIRFHVFPFLICAVALEASHVRTLVHWASGGNILVVLMCLLYGTEEGGRFWGPGLTISNPNDLSFLLLLSSAYTALAVFRGSMVARMISIPALLLAAYFIFRTGSRGTFLMLIVALVVALLFLPGRAKAWLLLGSMVCALILAMFVPTANWQRVTLISSDPEQELLKHPEHAADLTSQIARMELQKRAMRLTLEHPLLGVGPTMFMDNVDRMVREQTGRKSSWQNAHNVYLQIASENGIPALLAFIAVLIFCMKMNYQSFKKCLRVPALADCHPQCFCLFMATFIYSIGLLFSNAIYDIGLPILLGLSSANYLAIKSHVSAGARPAAPSVPPWSSSALSTAGSKG